MVELLLELNWTLWVRYRYRIGIDFCRNSTSLLCYVGLHINQEQALGFVEMMTPWQRLQFPSAKAQGILDLVIGFIVNFSLAHYILNS